MITSIGWYPYIAINYLACVEFTRDFYAFFKFELSNKFAMATPNVIRYRLLDMGFKLAINEFNLAFGFIDRAYSNSREYV